MELWISGIIADPEYSIIWNYGVTMLTSNTVVCHIIWLITNIIMHSYYNNDRHCELFPSVRSKRVWEINYQNPLDSLSQYLPSISSIFWRQQNQNDWIKRDRCRRLRELVITSLRPWDRGRNTPVTECQENWEIGIIILQFEYWLQS